MSWSFHAARWTEETDRPFCDGLADTLTARLAIISGGDLHVVPSSAVRAQRITTADQARQAFGATAALEGSLLRAGNTLRLNYFLVDAETNQQIDAVSLTARADDPFALQDQVVTWAAQVLNLTLAQGGSPGIGPSGTQAADAFSLYQQGRGRLAEHQTVDDVDAAIALLVQATERDPTFVAAHATLGQAYWERYLLSRDAAWVDRARSACDGALMLDSQSVDAQLCAGQVSLGTGRYEEAITSFRQAADRQPTSDDAYLGLARAYEATGDAASANGCIDRRSSAGRAIGRATGGWVICCGSRPAMGTR